MLEPIILIHCQFRANNTYWSTAVHGLSVSPTKWGNKYLSACCHSLTFIDQIPQQNMKKYKYKYKYRRHTITNTEKILASMLPIGTSINQIPQPSLRQYPFFRKVKILLMSRVHDTWNLLMTHLLWKTPWFPLQQLSPRQLIPETEDYPFEIWTLVTVNFERGAGV